MGRLWDTLLQFSKDYVSAYAINDERHLLHSDREL